MHYVITVVGQDRINYQYLNHLYLSQLANFQPDGFCVHLGNKQGWSWKPELLGFPPELFTFVPGGNEYIPSMQEAQGANVISHSTSSTSRKKTLKLPTHGQWNPFFPDSINKNDTWNICSSGKMGHSWL